MTHHIHGHYDHAATHVHHRHVHAPIKRFAERHTFFRLLGSVEDLSVLDLACGDGSNTESIKARGAGKVVGVDISADMIHMAHFRAMHHGVAIEYRLNDAAELGSIGQFDVVTAAQFFHYATSREQLAGFCRTIYQNLKPGGRFVSVGFSPFTDPEAPSMRRYGFELELGEAPEDGDQISGRIFLGEGDAEPALTITHHYWSPRTYESSLRAAGLRDIGWQLPEVSSEGLAEHGEEFWQPFLEHPFFVGLSCRRPS